MVLFYKIWKKYEEIRLTKNKIDLNNRKMINRPPSPRNTYRFTEYNYNFKFSVSLKSNVE